MNLSCVSVGENADYELQVSPPNSNGSFCPGEVEFTCIGRNVSSALNWFINKSSIAQYVFSSLDTFPYNVNSSFNITIVNATGSIMLKYIESTWSGNFSYLRGVSIHCGRNPLFSHNFVVEGYGKYNLEIHNNPSK